MLSRRPPSHQIASQQIKMPMPTPFNNLQCHQDFNYPPLDYATLDYSFLHSALHQLQ
jgi:hypothetical protein